MCDRIVSVFTIVDERLCVASSYLVGEGGGEASSEVICWVKQRKCLQSIFTSFSHQAHVTTLRLRKGNMQNLLLTCTSGTGFTFLTLLLSAMLYGRGRKVLTLWGGRECSSSDSGVRANKPGDTSLSSWPVLVLLALDKKRELKGRSQTERKENTGEKKKKRQRKHVESREISVFTKNTVASESKVNVTEKGGGKTEDRFMSSWLSVFLVWKLVWFTENSLRGCHTSFNFQRFPVNQPRTAHLLVTHWSVTTWEPLMAEWLKAVADQCSWVVKTRGGKWKKCHESRRRP